MKQIKLMNKNNTSNSIQVINKEDNFSKILIYLLLIVKIFSFTKNSSYLDKWY